MSGFMSVFAEGFGRGIGKLVGLAGFFMILFAIAMVVRIWNAKNTYSKIQATITSISVSDVDTTAKVVTYEYLWDGMKVTSNETYAEDMGKGLRVGGIIQLLKDQDTNDTLVVGSEPGIKAISLKAGIMGVVLMIGAYIFMRMNPKPE